MILDILLLINESKLLLELYYSIMCVDIFLRFLSDKSLDKYISNIVNVSDRCRY